MKKLLLAVSLPLILIINFTFNSYNGDKYDYQEYVKYKIEQKKLKKAKPGFPDKAMQWYYEQRAYPLGEIPLNWRETALQHIKQNNQNLSDNPSLTWTELGPGNIGGRIRAIAVHPSNPDIVYIGSVSGGIWKTVNGGGSWTPLKDHMENIAVCSIVLDPQNPDIIYAGTGEGYFNLDAVRGEGIFKSVDAGANWSRLSSTNNQNFYYVNKLAFDLTTNALYAATRKGLFRSSDGGSSFSAILTGTGGGDVHCTDVEVAYTSPVTVFCSFGVFNQSSVFRSSDGGNTFAQNLSVNGAGRVELASSQSNPLYTYFAMADLNTSEMKLLGYTSDAGQNWYSYTVPGPSYSGQNNYAGNQAWYNNILAVDPDNYTTLFAGGIDLWRSLDGGSTWAQMTNWYPQSGAPQYAHADFHEIVYAPSNHNIMYLGNDGGIYKSVNRGANWTSINNNLGITQFYYGAVAQSGGKLYGGTQDNGNISSTGTTSWSELIGGDGGAVEVNFNNPNIIYAEYVHLCFFKSTDGGNTFYKKMSGIPAGPNLYDGTTDRTLFISPFVMDPNNPDIIIAGTYRIWKTVNGADNWSSISGDLTGDGTGPSGAAISTIAVAKGNSSVIYAGCSNGRIQVTTDNGGSWAIRNSGLPNAYCTRIVINPANPAAAYASFSGFLNGAKVYKTTNYGQSWTNISTNLPNIPVSSLLINPSDANNIIAGTDLGIFTTADGGGSWVQNNQGLANVPVLDIDYRSDGKIFAATHGRGMYSTSLSGGSSVLNYIYDDGEPTSGYFWPSAGQGSANRITPGLSGAKLVQMSIYIHSVYSGNAVYKPIVLRSVNAEPGSDYVNIDFKTAGSYPGWDITDLSAYNIVIDDEFFVGLKYDGSNMPTFGYDPENNGRAWDFDGSSWTFFNETYFMRAALQTLTSVEEIDTRIPDAFEVSANYPNPFNPSTSFRYALPSGMDVNISIYDINGKLISTLVDKFQAPGSYEVTWNGKNNSGVQTASGVYFYNVTAGKYIKTGKMLLLK